MENFLVSAPLATTILLLVSGQIYGQDTSANNQTKEDDAMVGNLDTPPLNAGKGRPLPIDTYVTMEGIGAFNEKDMDFRFEYYIVHKWNVSVEFCEHYNKSLRETGITFKEGEEVIVPFPSFDSIFWWPDTFVSNAKSEQGPAKVATLRIMTLSINEDKTCKMFYVSKTNAVVACQFSMEEYPIDIQKCTIPFRSYAYETRLVNYNWGPEEDSIQYAHQINLAQHSKSLNKSEETNTILNSSYSVIFIEFTFSRRIASNLIGNYAPSFLIVVMSWLSFWMSLSAVNSRVLLIVTSMLALATQFASVRKELPTVSYINLVDVWMLTCLLYVFATLVEFTIVKSMSTSGENIVRSMDVLMTWKAADSQGLNRRHSRSSALKAVTLRSGEGSKELRTRVKSVSSFARVLKSSDEGLKYLTPMSPRILPSYAMNSSFGSKNRIWPFEPNLYNFKTMSRLWYADEKNLSSSEFSENLRRRRVLSGSRTSDGQTKTLSNVHNQPVDGFGGPRTVVSKNPRVLKAARRVKAIERFSRVFFPLSFALFNVCYWFYIYRTYF